MRGKFQKIFHKNETPLAYILLSLGFRFFIIKASCILASYAELNFLIIDKVEQYIVFAMTLRCGIFSSCLDLPVFGFVIQYGLFSGQWV